VIKLAVIGCGHWGPNHIRIFNNLRESKVVAAVDLDKCRLERMREMFPKIQCEQDYKLILNNQEIDAVVIVTPTNTHYRLVRDALLSGKHTLCEKPLCETGVQARELVELARTHNLILMVGHVFIFNAGIVKVKEILDAGELCELHYLSAVRTNLGPVRNDINAAYDLATHDISIFNWLLGNEPEFVSATGASFLQPGIEDVVLISLKYPDNVLASIQASWLNPKKVRRITVVGSQKMVTWDDLEMSTPVAIYDRGANATQEYSNYGEFLRISFWDGDVRLPKVHLEEPLKVQDRYFLKAIQRGAIERSDGEFGTGVVGVLEAISQSLKRNGIPIQINKE
jgi:predicted dehydrogenase